MYKVCFLLSEEAKLEIRVEVIHVGNLKHVVDYIIDCHNNSITILDTKTK